MSGRLPQLTVVTTDLFPELVERIRAGAIAATVYRCIRFSGREAASRTHHVVPHLVMRRNLDLFLERLPADLERA
jgi:hypothetical protein